MKTLVRVQEFNSGNHGFLIIQILNKRFRDLDMLEPIGEIKFQKNLSEDDERFYAMNFHVETDNPDYIMKMAKLAKFIKANTSYDSQPSEILEAIGAVEYKVFQHEFVAVSKEGENLYDVIAFPGSLHSRIIAPNDIVAQKLLDKKNMDKAELKFNSKIQF